jgi:hypothetical protein
MARAKTTGAGGRGAAGGTGQGGAAEVALPVRPEVEPIARLTASAQEILARGNGRDAQSRVELGAVLVEVRGRLAHGAWLEWLADTVPFTPRSAQNHMKLSKWAGTNRAMFERLAPLGTSKLMLLSRLEPSVLERLLAKPEHVGPKTGRRLTLLAMPYPEFLKLLVEASKSKPTVTVTDPMEQLAKDARSSAKKTVKLIKQLIANKESVDEDVAEDLHDDLTGALAALAKAFKLDAG